MLASGAAARWQQFSSSQRPPRIFLFSMPAPIPVIAVPCNHHATPIVMLSPITDFNSWLPLFLSSLELPLRAVNYSKFFRGRANKLISLELLTSLSRSTTTITSANWLVQPLRSLSGPGTAPFRANYHADVVHLWAIKCVPVSQPRAVSAKAEISFEFKTLLTHDRSHCSQHCCVCAGLVQDCGAG